MNKVLLVGLIFALQIICLIYASVKTKEQKNRTSYYLASKKLTFWPLVMTFIATLIGGGSTLGAAEEAYNHGYIIFLYPLGGLVGFILIAFWLGRKLHSLKISTLAQILEDAFQSANLRKIASVLSIIALFSIFIGQIIATRKFLISLDISNDWILIGFWLLVAFYTSWGGLKAVAYTDVIQGLFFMAVFISIVIFLDKPVLINSLAPLFQTADYHIDKYSSWFFLPMLFMLIEQDVAQRCLGASDSSTVKKAALVAAIVSFLISMIPICLGSSARFHSLNLPLGSSVLICAVQEFMSPIMAAFAGSAVIAAIVSTADSQLNAISSNIACDFSRSLTINGIRKMTMLVSLIAIGLSYLFENVIDVIMFSLELYISVCFVSILYAIYGKKHKKAAAYSSMICGLFAFIFMKLIHSKHYPTALISLAISYIGYVGFFVIRKAFVMNDKSSS